MTSEPTIPAAIVEKAAQAKYYRANSRFTWEEATESHRQEFRDSVTRTLTPVYADIKA